MSREFENYRPILEDILTFSNGRRNLSAKDVAAYLGRSESTVRRRYGVGAGGILAPVLARTLAKEAKV